MVQSLLGDSYKRFDLATTDYQAIALGRDGAKLVTLTMSSFAHDPDAVVVRPISVGLCISDVKEAKGLRPIRSDFGHEVYGVTLPPTYPHS